MRAFVVEIALLCMCFTNQARAECAKTPERAGKLEVQRCTAVDTSKLARPAKPEDYAGLVLEVTETIVLRPAERADLPAVVGTQAGRVFVPAAEGRSCSELAPGSIIEATVVTACCEGAPNVPCALGTSQMLQKTKVTRSGPRGVKQMSRTELEREVEQLRAENASLRADQERRITRDAEMREDVENQQAKIWTKKLH
jgi:hypothetical protein